VSEKSVAREAVSDFGILKSGKSGPFGRRRRLRILKIRLAIALRSSKGYIARQSRSQNGNSGL
jgi:hypothetical protein